MGLLFDKRGIRIVFDRLGNGNITDQTLCKKYLKLGKTYTINSTEIGRFYSYVYLKGIRNKHGVLIAFDTTNFSCF